MKLELTVEETNQILNVLGQVPYGQVYQLIANIQRQAQEAMTDGNTANNSA